MTAEALLIVSTILAVAVILGILIIYRSGRSPSGIVSILEQRLLSIEGAIGRSDAAIREEFGRGCAEYSIFGQGAQTFGEDLALRTPAGRPRL